MNIKAILAKRILLSRRKIRNRYEIGNRNSTNRLHRLLRSRNIIRYINNILAPNRQSIVLRRRTQHVRNIRNNRTSSSSITYLRLVITLRLLLHRVINAKSIIIRMINIHHTSVKCVLSYLYPNNNMNKIYVRRTTSTERHLV